MTINISHGDFVIIQEGLVDLPKIIILEAVSAEDALSVVLLNIILEVSETVNISESVTAVPPFMKAIVSDTILVEDFTGFPGETRVIEVFDVVIVQEGQSDNFTIVAIEDVVISEVLDILMTLLRVSASDTVTVIDAPTVQTFPIGSVGVIAFEAVIVQEIITPRMTVYISQSDVVFVVDGALNMDVEDSTTVSEDITIKLARLVLNVNEAVTVTEFTEAFGPGLSPQPVIIEELILAEDVTLLLTSLRPESQEAVTVTESVTVSVSSNALSMDVSDTVTIAENTESQPNPMQINEFTEIVTSESATPILAFLRVDSRDDIAIAESVTLGTNLLRVEANDSVTISELRTTRVGAGRKKRKGLLVIGAGE